MLRTFAIANWRGLVAARDYERDPSSREVLDRLARGGMVAAGTLGIGLVAAFVAGVLLSTDRTLAYAYPEDPKSVVVPWDKLLVAACCAVGIVLSRTRFGLRWVRLIVTAIVTIAAAAMVLDDVGSRNGRCATSRWRRR